MQQAMDPVGPLDVRRAGVLLHVTSLPGEYDAGDLGPAAYSFVDFLERAGCTVWQVLPLVPTHAGDGSPYNAISAMAGNPELISLDRLVDAGLLGPEQLSAVRAGELTRAEARTLAATRFLHDGGGDATARSRFDVWCAGHAWLEDYVRFVALRESLDDTPWTEWEPGLRDREGDALAVALAPLADRLDVLRVEQWLFASQWADLLAYAHEHGVLLFGDVPIFVSLDSADVWSSRSLFDLDDEGRPVTVTGVPPDYFSAEGQRWNNPHYDWAVMAEDGYAWWRNRVAAQRELFDLVRIDHFRGLEASWHIPADAPTAVTGEWVKSPGDEVLAALVETSGEGTLVAEDLGTITPEVEKLRRAFALPGMKVLQFAFDGDEDNLYLPKNHDVLNVVYTGTHDNDTTVGWWESQGDEVRANLRKHVLVPDEPVPWSLVRLAMASTARLAVVPAQDLLGLDSGSRMNVPGSAEGNWSWRAEPGVFDQALTRQVRSLVEEYDRLPPVLSRHEQG
jgi:4-alpha-glucanotransferase